jgi:ABC-type branched-subunit amino acid transport system ATPase component
MSRVSSTFWKSVHPQTCPGRLPYGLKKRVELPPALAAQPSLLLLDEPMAGMNVEGEGEDYVPLHPVKRRTKTQ